MRHQIVLLQYLVLSFLWIGSGLQSFDAFAEPTSSNIKASAPLFNFSDESAERDAKAICTEVLSTPFPPKDQPQADEIQELKSCDSYDLYYGNSQLSDHAKARKCAYVEMLNLVKKDADILSGLPILMMVYANGKGAERNLSLALRLACEDKHAASYELAWRVIHLDRKRHENVGNSSVDYCDDVVDGEMVSDCYLNKLSRNSADRAKQLSHLSAKWTEGERQKFGNLWVAWNNFLKLRQREIDQSGTERVQMVTSDQEELKDGFLASLTGFEQRKYPSYTKQDFVDADQELNLAYKNVLHGISEDNKGAVSRDDIKVAQRAWLKYRDAWVEFAKQKYPSVTAEAWKAWLTQDRTKQLREIYQF